MSPSLALFLACATMPSLTLATEVWQVAPDPGGRAWWTQTQPRKEHAVILIPGLRIHPVRPSRCAIPELHDWQEPRSELVRTLGREFDVFSFAYAQTASLDVVCHTPGLRTAVKQLRKAGYRGVVLIGHSAGGVIARHFVEHYPDVGVTKVIQVGSPNHGTELAAVIRTGYPKMQAPFVQSLSPMIRQQIARQAPQIHPEIEMVCVVCKARAIDGDGIVPLASQWPSDLQDQGIPARLVQAIHFEAMRTGTGARILAELARERLTRWSPQQVDQARKVLFREPDEPRK